MINEVNFEFCTPAWIAEIFGPFDFDPCGSAYSSKVLGIGTYLSINSNGLSQSWIKYKRIWINPPNYLTFPFLEKAVSTYQQANNEIYFLAPINILTRKRFHKITKEVGVKVYIPSGRIKFLRIYQDKEITPDFDSVILKFQKEDEIKFFDIVTHGGTYVLNETDT